MARHWTRALLGAALAAGSTLALTACDPDAPVPTTTPGSPAASATLSATTKPATAVAGTVLTSSGSEFKPATGSPVNAPANNPCPALVESGWQGDCGTIAAAGGTVGWVTEHKPSPGGFGDLYQAKLFTYANGSWTPKLQAADTEGGNWTGITIKGADLTGDGKPEILVAIHNQGTGAFLSFTIIHNTGNNPTVVAHPDELTHGAAIPGDRKVDEYQAEYPNDEPNCCPAYLRHRVIRWDGTHYRAEQLPNAHDTPAGSL
jgi:hypothetical protein